jgi:hypothetical protein
MTQTRIKCFFAALLLLSSASWALDGTQVLKAGPGETKEYDLGERGDRPDERLKVTLTNKSTKSLSIEVSTAMGVLVGIPQIDGLMVTSFDAEPFLYVNGKNFTLLSAANAKQFDKVKAKDMKPDDVALVQDDFYDGSSFKILGRVGDTYQVKVSW